MVIQSKNRRLGMWLMGQVIVSRDLVARLRVKVMKSVGVCTEMDTVMHRALGGTLAAGRSLGVQK